jgi:hypothetical protein
MTWSVRLLVGIALAMALPPVALAADQQSRMDPVCLVLSAGASEAGETPEQIAHRSAKATYFAGKVRAHHGRVIDALDMSRRPKSAQEAAAFLMACDQEFSEALMDLGANEERLRKEAQAIGEAAKPK